MNDGRLDAGAAGRGREGEREVGGEEREDGAEEEGVGWGGCVGGDH